jgi:hypothetical protein
MLNMSTRTVTLTLGAIVLFQVATVSDRSPRPPAGARAAIELIAGRPGRKFGPAKVLQFDREIKPFSRRNQAGLTARPALL